MIFLIEYDRSQGEIVKLDTFSDSARRVAEDARLELEIRLNRSNVDHEIVLLEADSEEALRRTQRRYFENLAELATPSSR
jgi:hypothetical protein